MAFIIQCPRFLWKVSEHPNPEIPPTVQTDSTLSNRQKMLLYKLICERYIGIDVWWFEIQSLPWQNAVLFDKVHVNAAQQFSKVKNTVSIWNCILNWNCIQLEVLRPFTSVECHYWRWNLARTKLGSRHSIIPEGQDLTFIAHLANYCPLISSEDTSSVKDPEGREYIHYYKLKGIFFLKQFEGW